MSGKGDGSFDCNVDLFEIFSRVLQSLKHCFGDQSPSKTTVFRWFKQFMFGARTLEDADRCGRMAIIITQENVSKVDCLIKKDPKMTCVEIQDIV